MTRRRTLVWALCGAAAAAPVFTYGQQSGKTSPLILRVGLVDAGAMSSAQEALFQRLAELGFVRGRNLSIEHDVTRVFTNEAYLDAAYAGIVKRGVDILLALGQEPLLRSARRAADGKLPVVFVAMDYDPVQSGYVASLARPAGTLTGLFVRQPELAVKRLEITRDILPRAKRVALLWDGNVARAQFDASSAAAASYGFELQSVELGSASYNFPDAIQRAADAGAEAILVASSGVYYNGRAGITAEAFKRGLPVIAFAREFVETGALLSYGVNVNAVWAQAAEYVARIARGINPANLPVEQPTRFELVVNGRTASSLGIRLTPALLGRADEVIE